MQKEIPTDQRLLARCRTLYQQQLPTDESIQAIAAVWVGQGQILHEALLSDQDDFPAVSGADRLYVQREPRPAAPEKWAALSGLSNIIIGGLHPLPSLAGQCLRQWQALGLHPLLLDGPVSFYEQVFAVNQGFNRSFITLKWASSADGYIAATSAGGQAMRTPITGPVVRTLVHQWRARHQAIMIGRRTAAIDKPSLNTRFAPGASPLRLVFDRQGKLEASLRLFRDGHPTFVLTDQPGNKAGTLRRMAPPVWDDWAKLARWCYTELGLCSIFVEGGRGLLQQILTQGIFDQVHRFEAPISLGRGLAEPDWAAFVALQQQGRVGEDLHFFGQKEALS